MPCDHVILYSKRSVGGTGWDGFVKNDMLSRELVRE